MKHFFIASIATALLIIYHRPTSWLCMSTTTARGYNSNNGFPLVVMAIVPKRHFSERVGVVSSSRKAKLMKMLMVVGQMDNNVSFRRITSIRRGGGDISSTSEMDNDVAESNDEEDNEEVEEEEEEEEEIEEESIHDEYDSDEEDGTDISNSSDYDDEEEEVDEITKNTSSPTLLLPSSLQSSMLSKSSSSSSPTKTTVTATTAATSEYDTPLTPPAMQQLSISIGVMLLSNRIDILDAKAVRLIRIAFVSYIVVVQLFLMYVRYQAKSINDRTPITIHSPLASLLSGSAAAVTAGDSSSSSMVKTLADQVLSTSTTILEYDLKQAKQMNGALLFPLIFNYFLHFKMKQVQPLLMQTATGIMNLIYSPLFQVYVLGRNLERPFKLPSGNPMMDALQQQQHQQEQPGQEEGADAVEGAAEDEEEEKAEDIVEGEDAEEDDNDEGDDEEDMNYSDDEYDNSNDE